jgi:hypothetical protein
VRSRQRRLRTSNRLLPHLVAVQGDPFEWLQKAALGDGTMGYVPRASLAQAGQGFMLGPQFLAHRELYQGQCLRCNAQNYHDPPDVAFILSIEGRCEALAIYHSKFAEDGGRGCLKQVYPELD